MPRTEHTLLIKGDFKDFQTKFDGLTSQLDAFSKKELGVNLKTDSLDFFKKSSKETLEELKRMQKITGDVIDELVDKIKNAKTPEEFARLNQQLVRTKRLAGQVGKEIANWEKPGRNVAGMLRGLAGSMGGGGGAGMGILSKLGIVGAALAVPLAAFGGAYAMGAPRRAIAPQNLAMMGMGGPRTRGGLEAVREQGLQFGFGPQQTIQQQMMGMRAMGEGFRAAPFQRLGRMTGFSPEDLMGVGGGFRQAGMQAFQIPQAVEDMYVRAIAEGFDQARAIDFLKAISDHTATLAAAGGVSPKAIADILGDFMAGSDFFTQNAQRGLTAMAGISQAMSGTGPMSAVQFRSLARLMPEATMTDLLYAQQFRLEELGEQRPGDLPGAQEVLSSFLDALSTTVTGKTLQGASEEDIRRLVPVFRKQFGFSATLAEEVIRAKAVPGGKLDEETQRKIKIEQKNANAKLGDVMGSIDAQTEIQKARLSELVLDIGDGLVPMTAQIQKGVWGIFDLLAKKFGVPEGVDVQRERVEFAESERQFLLKRIKTGRASQTERQRFEELTKKRIAFYSERAHQLRSPKTEMAEWEADMPAYGMGIGGPTAEITRPPSRAELAQAKKEGTQSVQAQRDLIAAQKAYAESHRKAAKAVDEHAESSVRAKRKMDRAGRRGRRVSPTVRVTSAADEDLIDIRDVGNIDSVDTND